MRSATRIGPVAVTASGPGPALRRASPWRSRAQLRAAAAPTGPAPGRRRSAGRPRRRAHKALPLSCIVHQASHGGRQGRHVPRRDHDPIDPVVHDLAHPRTILHRHGGHAARHGLAERHWEDFAPRREHVQVGSRQETLHVMNQPGQIDPRAEPQPGAERLEVAAQRPVPRDEETPPGARRGNPSERFDQPVVTLLLRQAPDADDQAATAPGGPARWDGTGGSGSE